MNTNALQVSVIVMVLKIQVRRYAAINRPAKLKLTGLNEKMSALSKYRRGCRERALTDAVSP
jgi:hypothetical protein